jgi:hypothetical protein
MLPSIPHVRARTMKNAYIYFALIAVLPSLGCGRSSSDAPAPVTRITSSVPASATPSPTPSSTSIAPTPPLEGTPRVTCRPIDEHEPPGPQGLHDPILKAKRSSVPGRGSIAPDFTLQDTEGEIVSLSALLRAGNTVVLQLGSLTCPVFQSKVDPTNRLASALGDKAVFFYIYTQEAHPGGSPSPYQAYADKYVPASERHPESEWHVPFRGALIAQPTTYEERVALAKRAKTDLKITPRVLVDGIDNAVWRAYGSVSNGGFVITPDGILRESQVWFGADGIGEAVKKCEVARSADVGRRK